jgi:hypothetical protein
MNEIDDCILIFSYCKNIIIFINFYIVAVIYDVFLINIPSRLLKKAIS